MDAPAEYLTTFVTVAPPLLGINAVMKVVAFVVLSALADVIVTEPPDADARVELGVPRTKGLCPLIVDDAASVASV